MSKPVDEPISTHQLASAQSGGAPLSEGRSPIERLTEGQLACLRLVLQHKQTKEIARTLGIAPDTVKQRLGVAMRTLGVDTRVRAALVLQEHLERLPTRSVYPSETVAGDDSSEAESGRAEEVRSEDGPAQPDAATQVAAESMYAASPEETEVPHALTLGWLMTTAVARLGFGRPEPAGAGAGNRLPILHRILLIVLVAIGSVLSITGLVSAAKELVALRR